MENIKSVEIILREDLERAGLVILHMKEDVMFEKAEDHRKTISSVLRDMGYTAQVIASNCLRAVEVSQSGDGKLYGLWRDEAWVTSPDCKVITGTKPELLALSHNYQEEQRLGGAWEIRELPTEPDGES